MKGNIYTIRQGWYTLLVSAIVAFAPYFSNTLQAQSCKGFRTQTQSDWGEQPRRQNSAAYMYTNFAAAFPTGLTVGCTNKLVLTSPQAVTNLLPLHGNLSRLPIGTTTNPNNRRFTNPLAGQVVALKLNIAFDALDPNFSTNTILLKDLVVRRGPFANKTVTQVLDEAEKALGGCPVPRTLYQLNEIVTRINRNYIDGDMTRNYLACPVVVVSPCSNDNELPVITGCPADITLRSPVECFQVLWEEPMATDNCTRPPSLTSNYYSGSCMPVGTTAVTYTAADTSGNTATCTFNVNIILDLSVGGDAFAASKGKLELDVQAEARTAKIAWVSEMPMEVDYFIVERMDANGEFVEVQALNGNAPTGLEFHNITDDAPLDGDNVYRVTSVLIDGSSRSSASKVVRFTGLNQVKVYPNPANDYLTVDMSNIEGKTANIYMYNQLGNLIKTYFVEDSAEPFNISVSAYKNGSYILRVATEGKRDITKQVSIIKD